ncbi:putative quinol monooxygenase [Mucilaginibacter pedocola]|uniref:ABM domain-containing protein n=1 Tax=Mucilaginibacter pedocola TaxID=1792845 RepID=A0A1S9PBU5_9SPHI|nr:antibiotic biosynthesis monooxygenase [Mucilaginibacter pedocola]OOQ58399.1 hypothetical protein BC343_06860 [Mucilaginibacter pedocola]
MIFNKLNIINPDKLPIIQWMVVGCIALLCSCDGLRTRYRPTNSTDTSVVADTPKTFQELGFFGDIKKWQWTDFVSAVQNNIRHSRKEQGNLSFSLYKPEEGKLQPIWFERYRDTVSHNDHKKQDYFKNAIKVIQQSLRGKPQSIGLKELSEIPARVPVLSEKPETTRYVIILFDVKPGKSEAFVSLMADLAKRSRQAHGNLEFNVYRYAEDANKFALVEGWQTVADHEAQMKRTYIEQLSAKTSSFFISDPMNTRWLVKDISQ